MSNKNLLSNKTIKNQNLKIDWKEIQFDMKEKFGKDIFESWLKKIQYIEEINNYLLLSVSTRFIRDWITSRYLDEILNLIKNKNKNITRIELRVVEKNDDYIINEKTSDNNSEKISFIKDSYLQYNRIDQNKKFDNFVVGPSNKLAFEAAKKSIR